MATITITITINDRAAANDWLQKVEDINAEYKAAMESAAKCLEDMTGEASGSIIDQIAGIGQSLMNAATQTFEAISAIAETVSKICDTVENFQDSVKQGISNLANKLFG